MKTFFGGIFINQEKLNQEGKEYPIKVEYYKKINEDEITKRSQAKYGIEIIKTEYKPEKIQTEKKEIAYLTNYEEEVEKILQIFRDSEVTPISAEDIISDFRKQLF